MKVVKKQLRKIEVKQLFEEFNDQILKEGKTAKYSLMVFKNAETLMPIWEQIMRDTYNENNDPEFKAFKDEQNATIVKYADRDEQGQIVYDGKFPKISDQIVEFNKCMEDLQNKYKPLFDKINEKQIDNKKLLLETVDTEVVVLDIEEFPATTPPFVVGLLCA